jgi:hypothetical protein
VKYTAVVVAAVSAAVGLRFIFSALYQTLSNLMSCCCCYCVLLLLRRNLLVQVQNAINPKLIKRFI